MTLYAPPDALLATVSIIRSTLAARSETYALGATVGTRAPDESVKPSAPFVLVAIDGAASRDRHSTDERATVRVSVWHLTDFDALALARLVFALLNAHPGDASVRFFAPLSGPIPASDPETGQPLSTFTTEARLRPITL